MTAENRALQAKDTGVPTGARDATVIWLPTGSTRRRPQKASVSVDPTEINMQKIARLLRAEAARAGNNITHLQALSQTRAEIDSVTERWGTWKKPRSEIVGMVLAEFQRRARVANHNFPDQEERQS